MAGQLDAPIGSDQAEAIPSSAPGLADAATFEDDVLAPKRGELVAYCQTGLARADDYEIERFRGAAMVASRLASTDAAFEVAGDLAHCVPGVDAADPPARMSA